jgi:ATP-dependent RNA helicase DDX31/DBP7
MEKDNNLTLNFAVEQQPPITKRAVLEISKIQSTLKKGSWRQKRLTAKKIIQKIKKRERVEEKEEEQPVKKVEVETFKRKAQVKVGERVAPKASGFTSSIFTANPSAPLTRKEEKKSQDLVEEKVFSDTSFHGLGIHPVLSGHLEKLKVITPTEIQKLSIPQLTSIKDRDIIIQAQTGSGKTFAFLLPILHQLLMAGADYEKKIGTEFFSRASGAFAIILAPTRELAQQIAAVLDSLLRYTRNTVIDESNSSYCRHWMVSGLITGGESKKSEKARLRKGINILVATPGRLLDHLKTTEAFEVGNLRWLVLDEADNLLHLGFEETLKEILFILNEKGMSSTQKGQRMRLNGWPFERQTILCSATIEGGVETLAQTSLRKPIFLRAGKEVKENASTEVVNEESGTGDAVSIPQQLKQFYVLSPAKLRLVNLLGLLRKVKEFFNSRSLKLERNTVK